MGVGVSSSTKTEVEIGAGNGVDVGLGVEIRVDSKEGVEVATGKTVEITGYGLGEAVPVHPHNGISSIIPNAHKKIFLSIGTLDLQKLSNLMFLALYHPRSTTLIAHKVITIMVQSC
jgi:hypothetical protein